MKSLKTSRNALRTTGTGIRRLPVGSAARGQGQIRLTGLTLPARALPTCFRHISEFTGQGRARQRSYAQRGDDIRYDVTLTLEEAYVGLEKEINITSSKECETCHGHGTADGKEPPVCATCGGSGKVRTQQGGFLCLKRSARNAAARGA